MGHYSTVGDYLRDAYEAIDFYAECACKHHGQPFIESPWMHTERITRLFEYAINETASDYFNYGSDIPYLCFAYVTKEDIDILKNIISNCIRCVNDIHKKNLRITSDANIRTELKVNSLLLLKNALKDESKSDLILSLLSLANCTEIFSLITLVSAYLGYKFYGMENYEQAMEFIACAQLSAYFSSDSYLDLDTAIEERQRKHRQRAAKKGAKNRVEAKFKEDIFIPSWHDWQNGDIEYKTKAAFLDEMVKQSKQYFKDSGSNKEAVTIRTLQNWLATLQNP